MIIGHNPAHVSRVVMLMEEDAADARAVLSRAITRINRDIAALPPNEKALQLLEDRRVIHSLFIAVGG